MEARERKGGDQPSTREILDAVSQSGYLLEQQIGNQMEELQYNVLTNYAYPDPDEGTSRELDVLAFRREFLSGDGRSVWLEVLIECKRGEQTLVFFSRASGRLDVSRGCREVVFGTGDRPQPSEENPAHNIYVSPLFQLGLAERHHFWSSGRKSTQFCVLTRSGKHWRAEHGPVYTSLVFPLVKALNDRIGRLSTSGMAEHVWIFYPVVVTSSPIYVVGTEEPISCSGPVSQVTLRRHVSGKKLKGYYNIDFVHRDAFPQFIQTSVRPFVDAVVALAKSDPLSLFKGQQRPGLPSDSGSQGKA